MRSSLLAALALIAAPTIVLSAPAADADTTVRSDPRNAAVLKAVEDARATLPVFWSKFGAQAPGYSQFGVKVALRTDDGRGVERLWMAVDALSADGKVRGRLASEPVAIKRLKLAAPLEVTSDQIVDWQYVKDGKAYGHYSTRAMMNLANEAQRAQAMQFLAPTPLEPDAS